MKSIPTRIFLALLLPCGLAFINLIWTRAHGVSDFWSHAWPGVVAVISLSYAAGLLTRLVSGPADFTQPESQPVQQPWLAWSLIAAWTLLWSVVWFSLPTGSYLRVMLPVAFFVLVWGRLASAGAGQKVLRESLMFSLSAVVACIAVWLLSSPFRRARILEDWTGPCDFEGRHYQYAQVLKSWYTLKLWGPSELAFTNVRSIDLPGMELLRLMTAYGALPGVALGVSMALTWGALWLWLLRKTCGPQLSAEMRNLGLALVALHGLASAVYVLFNLGFTPYPTGFGLLPMATNATWWMMGAALIFALSKAIGDSASQVKSGAVGSSGWMVFSGYALVGVGLVFTVFLIKENQDRKLGLHLVSREAEVSRKVIRDASSQVMAENVGAYDLWFIPADFWGPSLLNPKASFALNSGSEFSRTDAERARVLIGGLEKWPQIQSVVSARLESWPKSKQGLALLAWAVTPKLAGELKALAIPGLRLKPRTARYYPKGALFAHAIGFTSLADNAYGQEGLEWVANNQLLTDSFSLRLNDEQGVRTTLVPEIQRAARDALKEGIKAHRATGGAIVVLDVRSNEIAAMVSAPDFDPNDASTYRNPYQPDRILNRATSLSFPIGALISPLVVAHALESGRVTPTSKLNIGMGLVGKENLAVRNGSVDDVMTVEDIVAKSDHVGLGRLAQHMPLPELQGIMKTLGIGEPLDIPGLTGGANARAIEWRKWTPGMHANPGLSIETSLMQVLRAYLPIATDGYMRTPTMLKTPFKDLYVKRVLSTDTADSLRNMLKLAASKQGTAPSAQVPGMEVAGKTGTTIGGFWTDAETGKKVRRSDTAAFVGMLPAEKPKWMVGVLLEFEHGKAKFAGLSAAPMFAALAQKALIESTVNTPATPAPKTQ